MRTYDKGVLVANGLKPSRSLDRQYSYSHCLTGTVACNGGSCGGIKNINMQIYLMIFPHILASFASYKCSPSSTVRIRILSILGLAIFKLRGNRDCQNVSGLQRKTLVSLSRNVSNLPFATLSLQLAPLGQH